MRYRFFQTNLQESLYAPDSEGLIAEGYVKFSFAKVFFKILSYHNDGYFLRSSLSDLSGQLSHFFREIKIEAQMFRKL